MNGQSRARCRLLPNRFLEIYRTPGFLLHRAFLLIIGVASGIVATRNFKNRGYSLARAFREPTLVSSVLIIEALTCPALGICCCWMHAFLFVTDAFPYSSQLFCRTLFSGWGLFTTKLITQPN